MNHRILNRRKLQVDCSCPINMEIDGISQLVNKKYQKARIKHICSECRKFIQPGEKYLKEIIKSDDEIATHKTCLSCESIRNVLFCDWYYGDIIDSLIDYILDSNGDISETCLAKLTPEAREFVCNKINEYAEG